MNIETLTNICRALPFVAEDVKWGTDLCFTIGAKMFCAMPLEGHLKVSIKVTDEEFGELSTSFGIIPAPYAARHKWILVEECNIFNQQQWEHYINKSYNLVKMKLPKKVLMDMGKSE